MKPRLLMIGGWTSIYRTAKSLGYDLTLVQQACKLAPDDYGLADQLITAELEAPELCGMAAAIHAVRPFDVVLSFQEMGVLNAALIREQLQIKGNPLPPVQLTRDKARMRRHMREHGIESIPFIQSADLAQLAQFGHAVGWPIIVKPTSGAGSCQIHQLSSPDGLAAAVAAIARDYPGLPPIAEKFICGREISVEAITWDGVHHVLAATDKITTGAPHFVETGHNLPAVLSPELTRRITALTERFLTSIGHQYGPSHTEMILGEDGPCIIESHTRTGGDYIFQMVEQVCGVDMFEATLRGFLGAFPLPRGGTTGAAAVRYLTLRPGTVDSVTGLAEASAAPGVLRCDVTLAPGATVGEFTSSDERYGCVVASGATRDEAVYNAETALATVQVTVAAAPQPGGSASAPPAALMADLAGRARAPYAAERLSRKFAPVCQH